MVQIFKSTHSYEYDFNNVALAYFNRYPNPYAKHVLSSDTLESFVDNEGCLRTTRLVVKTGRLPAFVRPLFAGKNMNSWVIEKSVLNPKTNHLWCYSANIDHRRYIKVEEYLTYTGVTGGGTIANWTVRFSLNFLGFRERIEKWGFESFASNINYSREGLHYVVNRLRKGTNLQ